MEKKVDVEKEIVIHAVTMEEISFIINFYTCGLNKYDWPELQVYAPAFLENIINNIMYSIANWLINDFKLPENENIENQIAELKGLGCGQIGFILSKDKKSMVLYQPVVKCDTCDKEL